MPRILYVVATCPFPAKRGKNVRQGSLLKALIAAGDTDLVVLDAPGAAVAAIPGLRGLHTLAKRLRPDPFSDLVLVQQAIQRGHGILARKYLHARAVARFSDLLERIAPDLVVLGGVDMAVLVGPCQRRGCAVIIDSDDLQSLRTSRIVSTLPQGGQKLYHRLLARNYRVIERNSLRRVDQVWVSSEKEALLARHLYELGNVRFVPNVLDLDRYRPLPEPAGGVPVVGFLGNFSYLPNEQAALALIAMHRRLRAGGQSCRLKLIGIGPTAAMRTAAAGDDAIVITGEVADVAAELAEVAVMAVPLTAGGGTKIKVLESMALERPVLMTEVGAEGLGVVPGRDAIVADLGRFEAELVALLADPARRAAIGRAGRALVERRFSLGALERLAEGSVREAMGSRQPMAPAAEVGIRYAAAG